jgi:hypothetical protein
MQTKDQPTLRKAPTTEGKQKKDHHRREHPCAQEAKQSRTDLYNWEGSQLNPQSSGEHGNDTSM